MLEKKWSKKVFEKVFKKIDVKMVEKAAENLIDNMVDKWVVEKENEGVNGCEKSQKSGISKKVFEKWVKNWLKLSGIAIEKMSEKLVEEMIKN